MFKLPKQDLVNLAKEFSNDINTFNKKSFLITGGTGFIGKWLIATLNELNKTNNFHISLTILTRDKNKFITTFVDDKDIKNLEFIESDIRYLDKIDNKELNFDYIILGANDATYDFSLNPNLLTDTLISGTRLLIEKFVTNKTKKILHLSSGAVYGDIAECSRGVKENDKANFDITNLGSMYGISKLLVESILNDLSIKKDIKIINARCFAFVGPYLPLDKHFAIGNFINNCLNSESIIVNGDGSPVRSYMYAADMVKGLLKSLKSKKSLTINIGSDKAVSISDLANLVSNELGNPNVIIKNNGKSHPEKSNYYLPDITLLKSLGYKESYDLKSSITKTYKFYKKLQ